MTLSSQLCQLCQINSYVNEVDFHQKKELRKHKVHMDCLRFQNLKTAKTSSKVCLQQEISSLSGLHSLKVWNICPHDGSTNCEEAAAGSLLHGELTSTHYSHSKQGHYSF